MFDQCAKLEGTGDRLEDLGDLAKGQCHVPQDRRYRYLAAMMVDIIGQLWSRLVDASRPGIRPDLDS
jgi:hypothetical protein